MLLVVRGLGGLECLGKDLGRRVRGGRLHAKEVGRVPRGLSGAGKGEVLDWGGVMVVPGGVVFEQGGRERLGLFGGLGVLVRVGKELVRGKLVKAVT